MGQGSCMYVMYVLGDCMHAHAMHARNCMRIGGRPCMACRGSMDKYVQAARLRIRELDANLKMTKRELRRARKTVKVRRASAAMHPAQGGRIGREAHAMAGPAGMAGAPRRPVPL